MKLPKPLKFFQTLNQPPRSPANGTNRRPSPPTHSNPSDRADSTDGAKPVDFTATQWTIPFLPFKDPKPPTVPYAGVRTGEIIGWRYWQVYADPVSDEQVLGSVAHYELWAPGEVKHGDINKSVNSGSVFPPSIFGGVYSFNNEVLMLAEVRGIIEEFESYLKFPSSILFDSMLIHCLGIACGTIKCWGEIVEHEHGYRAEYAKINSIDGVYGEVSFDDLRRKYLS